MRVCVGLCACAMVGGYSSPPESTRKAQEKCMCLFMIYSIWVYVSVRSELCCSENNRRRFQRPQRRKNGICTLGFLFCILVKMLEGMELILIPDKNK